MMCVCVRYAICNNVTYPSVCEIRTRPIMRTSPALPTIVCTVRTFFRPRPPTTQSYLQLYCSYWAAKCFSKTYTSCNLLVVGVPAYYSETGSSKLEIPEVLIEVFKTPRLKDKSLGNLL